MQIHGPSEKAGITSFTAELNTVAGEPFATVRMGSVRFNTDQPAECDAAIRVWVEAKQLLLGRGDPWCPAVTGIGGVTYYCDRPRHRSGRHHAPGAEFGAEVEWGGEPAPGPLAIACPSCGAEAGQRCTSDFGCMARYYAAEVAP